MRVPRRREDNLRLSYVLNDSNALSAGGEKEVHLEENNLRHVQGQVR